MKAFNFLAYAITFGVRPTPRILIKLMQATDKQEATARRLQQLHSKNLNFFKETQPNIYETFKDYQFKNLSLNIDPDNDEVDIVYKGESMYQGKARNHAVFENSQFQSVYSKGKPLTTLRPTFDTDFPLPRHYHEQVRALAEKSTLTPEQYQQTGYRMDDFYPMIVFCGLGSGLHIENFLKNNDVHQVIIVETELDYFAASLYTVDWTELYRDYTITNGKSLSIILGDIPNQDHIYSLIWNRVINYCPIFPLATLFYNHKANPKYEKPIAKVCEEIRVFINLFGFYDDEVNQLNNCLHNFANGIQKIPPKTAQTIDKPVCIVGSGPSLDHRIESLKRHRDKLTIISCGTSIKVLYANDIKPDMHIELESHFSTIEHIENTAPREWLKGIKFIGASQVNPLAFEFFDDKRLYFKHETAAASIFGSDVENISTGTPSCTNAATAIACEHNCQSVYFFGMDLGYANQKQHHSKHSIYYSEDAPEGFKEHSKLQEEDDGTFKVEGAIPGSQIKTTNNLFHVKRRVESKINLHPQQNFYNCSNGAKLNGAEWIDDNTFNDHINSSAWNTSLEQYLFDDQLSNIICTKEREEKLAVLEQALRELYAFVKDELSKPIESNSDMSKACFRINYYLQKEFTKKYNSIYYFIRGSVWHLLYMGFSHAMGIQQNELKLQFLNDWRAGVTEILENLPKHLHKVTSRDHKALGHDDPWIKITINEAEPKNG